VPPFAGLWATMNFETHGINPVRFVRDIKAGLIRKRAHLSSLSLSFFFFSFHFIFYI
jgi:hypothetical protein